MIHGWSPSTRPLKRRPSEHERWNSFACGDTEYSSPGSAASDFRPACRMSGMSYSAVRQVRRPSDQTCWPMTARASDRTGSAREGPEAAGQESVVGVEHRQPLAADELQAPVPSVRDARVLLEPNDDDAVVTARDGRGEGRGAVRGRVIDDDAFDRNGVLLQDRVEGASEGPFGVPARDQDGDERLGRSGAGGRPSGGHVEGRN